MKNKQNAAQVALGVGFVWFTSQFGGGFASGTQLYQYFINFGIWCLLTPALAQLFQAFFQWYALRFAYDNKTANYRDFCDLFYGKAHVVFSNLYEAVYLMLILLAPSIAFATGGSTLHELTGLPYLLCTVIVGVFIFLVALMDTDRIRKATTVVSYILIVGVLCVFIPNILAQWGPITQAISRMAAGSLPVGSQESGGLGSALWYCVLYGAYHAASIGLYVAHAQKFESRRQCLTSMVYTSENPAVDYFGGDTPVRVAVYVRVSTGSIQQTSSYELQKKYYEEYVVRHPN